MKFFNRFGKLLTPEQILERNNELLFGILSGVLLGFSFPPVPLPFLSFFALIPYFFVLEKKETLASINRYTYFTLFFFSLITLYWVGSWTKEADTFLKISGIALLIFSPFFYLIVSTLYYFSRKAFGKKTAILLFPLYWVTFEYLYSLTDIRFPWITLGNSLPYFTKFIQIADLSGVYGLSLIILYINVFLYLSLKDYKLSKKIKSVPAIIAISFFLIPLIYGIIRIHTLNTPVKKVKVGLIQPNINPWDKWQAENSNSQLNILLNLSEKAAAEGAKIIIWPESALPVYLLSGNNNFAVEQIYKFVLTNKVFLLTGMPDINRFLNRNEAPKDVKETKSGILYTSYNSILLFSPYTNDIQKYGKIKLVPFGEHVPFVEALPFLGDFIKWQVGISSWNVGKEQVVFNLRENKDSEIKAAGVICIESIYPDFVAGFVKKGAEIIAVVTNDSWYGYSSGPFQHEEIAVLRAVENRRTVVRAANGGISCIINPSGNIISSTKLFTSNYLVGDAVISDEKTFYTQYPLIIPLTASFISIVTILFFIYNLLSIKVKKRHE
jgi:apolipoprotein N-acyltransferase